MEGVLRMTRKKYAHFVILAMIFLFFAPFLAFAAKELTAEGAFIRDGRMSSAEKDGKPLDRLIAYTPESPAFYAFAELHDAPPFTKVRFTWEFVSRRQFIAEVEVSNENNGSDVFVYSTLTQKADPWPYGVYKVKVFLGDRPEPAAEIDFLVE
jgi:hypothetical protein